MTVPLSGTTVTITRVADMLEDGTEYDRYDPPAGDLPVTTVATGVRTSLDPPGASEKIGSVDEVVYTTNCYLDPCDLQSGDTVTDAAGTVWECLEATTIVGYGIDYTVGKLRITEGSD